jgi:adenosylcobinamide amidohydrolase
MPWETLLTLPSATVRRYGRYIVADLQPPSLVLSTSARNGGQNEGVRHLVNHQSCEGSGHAERAHLMTRQGQEAYHDAVCDELTLPRDATVMMGTAANMHYASLNIQRDADVEIAAVVTAGVQTNATCAGDPAGWRETADGLSKVAATAGTINIMLLVDTPLTPATLARTAVTMTEAKSAALQRLAVPSCYSPDLATGTGTDQFCIAAPMHGRAPLKSASPHMKFGEIVGVAVRDATAEALRWQNGLEPSYTRGIFHALGRYGVTEATIFDELAGRLTPGDLELLRTNAKAVFYEPLAGAAAHALAAVLDRVRYGTLPPSVAHDAAVQQAATLAACLSAQPDRWVEFRTRLHPNREVDPRTLVLDAVALGWSEKWRPR